MFQDRVSQCSSTGCPEACFINHAGPKLRDLLASADLLALGLKGVVCYYHLARIFFFPKILSKLLSKLPCNPDVSKELSYTTSWKCLHNYF